MATTTATLTLSSSDLTGDALALSTTSTLTKADYDDDKAHKVYIRNTSTVATENIAITVESQLLGRLYAGDWALLPFNGDQDIKVTPSVATALTVEYLVIFE